MLNFFSLWVKNRVFIIYLLYQNGKRVGKKIIFSSVLIILLFLNLEIRGVFLVFIELTRFPFGDEEYRRVWKNRDVNFWLVLLVLLIYIMVVRVDLSFKISLNFLFLVMYMLMKIGNLVVFFLIYEIIFVLIIFAIIVLGYSYERLIAGYLILFYSFIFSRPRLILIIIIDKVYIIKEWLIYNNFLLWFLLGSFVVKFPVFGFHYWLPVAHVEASTVGSMLLAGLLLKLGRLGLIYLIIYIKFMVKWHWVAMAVPLIIIMILIVRDLKIIIAYSSVAHIRMVYYVIITGRFIGKKGSLIMMFSHGFISPLMFWTVGLLAWWKTRSLMVVKIISFSYLFLMVLFVLLILNIGFPPFIRFMREVLMLKSVINFSFSFWLVVVRVLISCYYNVYLYWCFNNFIGLVYKIRFNNFEIFVFLGLVLILNFYWESDCHGILWLCRVFSSDYIYWSWIFIISSKN